jgi:hypothetical protein
MLGKRRAGRLLVLTIALAIAATAVIVVMAQGGIYEVSRWTLGGAASSGGSFSLDGTAGQPVAGQSLTGGDFALTGGFSSQGDESHEVYLPVVLRGFP